MAITKEKAIDILDRIDFFQGQRAGRELWNEKPRYVQEIDLKAFQEDVALLREYIADVVPKIEVEKLNNKLMIWKQDRFNLYQRLELYEMARKKVAREIFEEIEEMLQHHYEEWDFCYYDDALGEDFDKLKKKYTEEQKHENQN